MTFFCSSLSAVVMPELGLCYLDIFYDRVCRKPVSFFDSDDRAASFIIINCILPRFTIRAACKLGKRIKKGAFKAKSPKVIRYFLCRRSKRKIVGGKGEVVFE